MLGVLKDLMIPFSVFVLSRSARELLSASLATPGRLAPRGKFRGSLPLQTIIMESLLSWRQAWWAM